MKYLGIIIFLILVVVIISFGATKIPQWLGFEKAGEISKVEVPAKKPAASKPKPAVITAPTAKPETAVPTIYLPHVPDYLIPPDFTREQLSPHFGKLKFSYVTRPGYGRHFSEMLLYANLGQDERLNITGWQIRNWRKEEVTIPKGAEIYDPLSPPADDILLKSGDSVKIFSNTNPLNLNLRLNKCTGYLEKLFDFTPDLPLECPRYSQAEIRHLHPFCQDYILSLGTCEIPTSGALAYDSQCHQFLSKLSYKPCVDEHRNDPYFIKSQWFIWIKKDILDPRRDRLLLFDKEGLLVNEYTYSY